MEQIIIRKDILTKEYLNYNIEYLNENNYYKIT